MGNETRVGTIAGNTWTHLDVPTSTVFIYEVQNVPAQLPVDPRELGTFRVGEWLSDPQHLSAATSARLAANEEHGTVAELTTSVHAEEDTSAETTVVFAERHGYLPVQVRALLNGVLAYEIQFSYQRGMGTELLDQCTYTFYSEAGSEPAPSQRVTFDVDSVLSLDDCAGVSFQADWEGIAEIRDNVHNRIRAADPIGAPRTIWPIIAANVALLIVIALLVRRSRRRETLHKDNP
jgi:hypothetical protein